MAPKAASGLAQGAGLTKDAGAGLVFEAPHFAPTRAGMALAGSERIPALAVPAVEPLTLCSGASDATATAPFGF